MRDARCANHTTDSTFRKTEIFLSARLDRNPPPPPVGQINPGPDDETLLKQRRGSVPDSVRLFGLRRKAAGKVYLGLADSLGTSRVNRFTSIACVSCLSFLAEVALQPRPLGPRGTDF